jgi:hypothetical protein
MPRLSYGAKARGERALMASLFQPEQDEKRGDAYGTEWRAMKRPLDNGGIRDRGFVRPDHSTAARHNTSRIRGLGRSGDRDFGPGDRSFGYAHVDGGLARPAWASQQQYHPASPGAGLSGGKPEWASVNRVRSNAGVEYAWDPKGDHNYYYPAARGPFR